MGIISAHWELMACGLCRCFAKNTPPSDRHTSSWPAGTGPGAGDGTQGDLCSGWKFFTGGGGGGAVTETGGQEGYPGIYLPCLTLEGLSPSPAREPDSLKALPGWRSVAWQSEQASGTSRAGCHGPLSGSGEKTLTKAGKGVLTYNVCPGHF